MPAVLLCTLALLCLPPATTAAATVYNVGDSAGWDVSADFDKWPVDKNFTVGDVLMFLYSSYHTVKEVDKGGFDNCSTGSVILSGAGGNTTVELSRAGDWYFVCGVPSHCFGGMKLHVRVLPAAGTTTTGRPTADSPSPPSLRDPSVIFGGVSRAERGSGHHRWSVALAGAAAVSWWLPLLLLRS